MHLNPLWFTAFIILKASQSHQQASFAFPGFNDVRIAGDLQYPTTFDFAPDGNGFYVTEKRGALLFVSDKGQKNIVRRFDVSASGERGLLGLACASEGIYLYMTTSSPRNRIIRLPFPNVASVTEEVLFESPDLGPTNHNGGGLRMSGDYVFAGVGDNARPDTAQDPLTALGKLIRIPRSGAKWQIFASGVRNPFRLDFTPDGTGYATDVGQDSFEEINALRSDPGLNYGWPRFEGYSSASGYQSPIHAYNHREGRCSIFGISTYQSAAARESSFGLEYEGGLFYADYCTSELLFRSRSGSVKVFARGVHAIDMRVRSGALYYLSYNRGELRRIALTVSGPVFSETPKDVTLARGETRAAFRCSAPGATLSWVRNGRMTGTRATIYRIAAITARMNGTVVECRATRDSKVISARAMLFVVRYEAPVATILQPVHRSYYEPAGLTTFVGFARPERAILRLEIWLHHDTHRHPWLAAPVVANTSRIVRLPGPETEPSRSIWIRFILIAEDRLSGLWDRKVVDLIPPPLQIPFQFPASLFKLKRGPSWTEGPFRMLNGTRAWLADDVEVPARGNASIVACELSAAANASLLLFIDGRKMGTVNATSPSLQIAVAPGVMRWKLVPITDRVVRVGNVSMKSL